MIIEDKKSIELGVPVTASAFIMCNPLMDLIFPEADYSWIQELDAVPGSMNLVDYQIVERLLKKSARYTRMPGGSGANTARGLAWLAGEKGAIAPPLFLGAVGKDDQGRKFRSLLEKSGVVSLLVEKEDHPTGVSAILVTPDHERTMFTHLGACRALSMNDLPRSRVGDAAFLYVTGYNWDTDNQERAASAAAEEARKQRVRVCLDVADPFVSNRYREKLLEWIPNHVDILFANRDELKALTLCPGNDRDVAAAAGALAPLVVMKTGKDGCLIFDKGKIEISPGMPVVAKDTTGAGDSFAAGFLYGLLSGWDCLACGKIANRLASRICTVEGCDFSLLERRDVLNMQP